MASRILRTYPWTSGPLIACAPMRFIARAKLAVETSKAGGLGFIGSGEDQSTLAGWLSEAKTLCEEAGLQTNPLPIGVGFLNWGADLETSLKLIGKYKPVAVWLFAPHKNEDLIPWAERCRAVTDGVTQVWVHIGSVEEAKAVVKLCKPDVLIVQGGDAGGHGLNKSAGVIVMVPEVVDALQKMKHAGEIRDVPTIIAAGGIIDGRGLAAAIALGAEGVCMGTRFLAAKEAVIAQGYRDEVLRASDGGQNTVRSSVYDKLRGTTKWPLAYGGRGVINQSYHDAISGMDWEENIELYNQSMKLGDAGWGVEGRITTYAGTGVGLVRKEQNAGEIVKELREEYADIVSRLQGDGDAGSPKKRRYTRL